MKIVIVLAPIFDIRPFEMLRRGGLCRGPVWLHGVIARAIIHLGRHDASDTEVQSSALVRQRMRPGCIQKDIGETKLKGRG